MTEVKRGVMWATIYYINAIAMGIFVGAGVFGFSEYGTLFTTIVAGYMGAFATIAFIYFIYGDKENQERVGW